MSVRFPHTWRVEPGTHYWRVRRRRGRTQPWRFVAALLSRLRHWMRAAAADRPAGPPTITD